MTVRFLTTPGGEELVILPRAEYEDLARRAAEIEEDEADVAIYDARKAEASAVLPAEVTARMLRGDRLLKALRKWRGLTQVDIVAMAGIGQGYLSDLETGRRKGSSEALQKLAVALDVPASWLVDATRDGLAADAGA